MAGRRRDAWQGYGTVAADGEALVWRPGPDASPHVYCGFALRLVELHGSGLRLIRPAGGFVTREQSGRIGPGAFFYDARVGGLAVLIARGLDDEGRRMHDTAWFYVEKLLRSRALLRRRFSGPIDFKISPAMRRATGYETAVPAASGGEPLDAERLLKLGNEEAARRGEPSPTRELAVHFGLYAAARRDPLPPERFGGEPSGREANMRRLVRSVLLDPDLAPDDVTDEELQLVTDRFADAVDGHLDEDLERFNRWFKSPKNTLVTQMSKRQRAPGGALDPGRVTAALAELGWRGLLQGAKCVEAQMRAVAADLPEPLSAADRARFEVVYFRQDSLGGLSLCLLAERFGFLREAVWDLVERPEDPAAVGTLLRLLQYYAAAAPLRREVDRERKRFVKKSRKRDVR